MGRRATPIEETPGWDIYLELLSFVDTEQAIPNEHSLFQFILQPKNADLTIGQYRYYFGRLQKERYIDVEPRTRSIKILKRVIVPPELVQGLPGKLLSPN